MDDPLIKKVLAFPLSSLNFKGLSFCFEGLTYVYMLLTFSFQCHFRFILINILGSCCSQHNVMMSPFFGQLFFCYYNNPVSPIEMGMLSQHLALTCQNCEIDRTTQTYTNMYVLVRLKIKV